MARAGLIEADVAVVGAGAAGLYAALTAAEGGGRVALVSATPLAQTASYWAQGGLAAALAVDDSPELHLADTETAGRGLMRRSAGEVLVEQAPRLIGELQRLRAGRSSPRGAPPRCGAAPRTRRARWASGCCWRCMPERVSRTWSSSSSTPRRSPASRGARASSSRRRSAARARRCTVPTASA